MRGAPAQGHLPRAASLRRVDRSRAGHHRLHTLARPRHSNREKDGIRRPLPPGPARPARL